MKLSSNSGLKRAMRDQLVERHVAQVDASYGVYVVVWMDAPEKVKLKDGHKPRWDDLQTAKAELEQQARDLSGEELTIRPFILDASLR